MEGMESKEVPKLCLILTQQNGYLTVNAQDSLNRSVVLAADYGNFVFAKTTGCLIIVGILIQFSSRG